MSNAVSVRPIRTDEDLEYAKARISELMACAPGTPEDDELDILLTLAQAYEHEHFPVGPTDPVEAVKFAMDRLGLAQKDLVPFFGSKPRVSEFLHGKRPLTVETVRKLHDALGIPAEVLIS